LRAKRSNYADRLLRFARNADLALLAMTRFVRQQVQQDAGGAVGLASSGGMRRFRAVLSHRPCPHYVPGFENHKQRQGRENATNPNTSFHMTEVLRKKSG
jgi:hypothetical protein